MKRIGAAAAQNESLRESRRPKAGQSSGSTSSSSVGADDTRANNPRPDASGSTNTFPNAAGSASTGIDFPPSVVHHKIDAPQDRHRFRARSHADGGVELTRMFLVGSGIRVRMSLSTVATASTACTCATVATVNGSSSAVLSDV